MKQKKCRQFLFNEGLAAIQVVEDTLKISDNRRNTLEFHIGSQWSLDRQEYRRELAQLLKFQSAINKAIDTLENNIKATHQRFLQEEKENN